MLGDVMRNGVQNVEVQNLKMHQLLKKRHNVNSCDLQIFNINIFPLFSSIPLS